MKKSIVEQIRGRPKYLVYIYLHIALNFQSDFPNLIDLRAIFSQSLGPPAPGSERQENPCQLTKFEAPSCYSYQDITNTNFQSPNLYTEIIRKK